MAKKKLIMQDIDTAPQFEAMAEETIMPGQVIMTPEELKIKQIEENSKPRKTYSKEEALVFEAAGETRGRKGLALKRINYAPCKVVYDYVRTMSKYTNKTISEFIDGAVRADMERNLDTYKRLVEFSKEVEENRKL